MIQMIDEALREMDKDERLREEMERRRWLTNL
jgi:hypothetical protein